MSALGEGDVVDYEGLLAEGVEADAGEVEGHVADLEDLQSVDVEGEGVAVADELPFLFLLLFLGPLDSL